MFLSSDIACYIISLGCAKNLVDSERINGVLAAAGFSMAASSEDADIIIINTCGFIRSAKEESIEVLFDALSQAEASPRRLRRFEAQGALVRRHFPVRVVAAGCLVRRYLDEISADIPELDFIYGIPDQDFVPALCRRFDIQFSESPSSARLALQRQAYSYIKISDGCSNNCSYCAIPLIRGPHRSFAPELVLSDARDALRAGARELVIVAQDISRYGWKDWDLSRLVHELSLLEGAEWIRLMYCHPDHIDERIVNLLAGNPRVVKYLDIPFQHASRDILASMGRSGDRTTYLDLIRTLRRSVPGIRLRSTFMLGYPGETEENFSELLAFIGEARLDRAGAFMYSPEEDTSAFTMGDPVTAREKKRRYNAFMALQQKISTERLEESIGTEMSVLVEAKLDDETYLGRSEYDAPEVDGIFYLTSRKAEINSIVRVRVTGSTEYDLMGVIA